MSPTFKDHWDNRIRGSNFLFRQIFCRFYYNPQHGGKQVKKRLNKEWNSAKKKKKPKKSRQDCRALASSPPHHWSRQGRAEEVYFQVPVVWEGEIRADHGGVITERRLVRGCCHRVSTAEVQCLFIHCFRQKMKRLNDSYVVSDAWCLLIAATLQVTLYFCVSEHWSNIWAVAPSSGCTAQQHVYMTRSHSSLTSNIYSSTVLKYNF